MDLNKVKWSLIAIRIELDALLKEVQDELGEKDHGNINESKETNQGTSSRTKDQQDQRTGRQEHMQSKERNGRKRIQQDQSKPQRKRDDEFQKEDESLEVLNKALLGFMADHRRMQGGEPLSINRAELENALSVVRQRTLYTNNEIENRWIEQVKYNKDSNPITFLEELLPPAEPQDPNYFDEVCKQIMDAGFETPEEAKVDVAQICKERAKTVFDGSVNKYNQ